MTIGTPKANIQTRDVVVSTLARTTLLPQMCPHGVLVLESCVSLELEVGDTLPNLMVEYLSAGVGMLPGTGARSSPLLGVGSESVMEAGSESNMGAESVYVGSVLVCGRSGILICSGHSTHSCGRGGRLCFLLYGWIKVTCEHMDQAGRGSMCGCWCLGLAGPSLPKLQPHLIQYLALHEQQSVSGMKMGQVGWSTTAECFSSKNSSSSSKTIALTSALLRIGMPREPHTM